MKRTLQAKLLILGIFIVGILTGAVLMDVYETRVFSRDADDGNRAGRIRDNSPSYVEYLELSPDQAAQIRGILNATRDRVRELRRQTQPMYEELTEESRNRIRALLSDLQRERYNEWIAERDQREQREREERRRDR